MAAAKERLIKSRRALDDLYADGVEVRIRKVPRDAEHPTGRETEIAALGEGYVVDEDGKRRKLEKGEVAMWIQPPSPLQREMALRMGNAARAKARFAAKRDPESVEQSTIMAFLSDMSDDTLREYVVMNDLETRRQDAIREVLGEDEWQDITALQDALRGFEERRANDPTWKPEEDPEYLAIEEKQDQFADQVDAREKELRDASLEVLQMLPREKVEEQALEKRLGIVESQAFMYAYEQEMNYYSVRDIEDHDELYFASSFDLANRSDEIQDLIRRALSNFITDGGEAKNLPGVASGSDSSELPSKPEISEASIPEARSA